MKNSESPGARLSEIVGLLRRWPLGSLPESLTDAAQAGDIPRMLLFVERGANLNQRSIGFASPLAAACSAGRQEAVRWLIEHGAALDVRDATVSPIQAALGKGNCAAAAMLLDAGLPLENAAWGVAAAAVSGNLPMLRWLLGRGIELDRAYPRLGLLREHALRGAEKNGQLEMAEILRGKAPIGAQPEKPPAPAPAKEPQMLGEGEKRVLLDEAMGLLRKAGKAAAKWKAIRPTGSSNELLISYAAQCGVIEIVQALLDAGAEPDFAEPGTPPPLYRAAEAAHCDVARLLLERGASPNGADGKSWLPLLGAVQSGAPEMVKLLLEAGAKPKAKPAGGQALAQCVRGPYAQEIAALLAQPQGTAGGRKPARKK